MCLNLKSNIKFKGSKIKITTGEKPKTLRGNLEGGRVRLKEGRMNKIKEASELKKEDPMN
jgi:hypothetical protein